MGGIRTGVIGCGKIAQLQHLPNLKELSATFEIVALCDLSTELLGIVGDQYDVPTERRYHDYEEMLASGLDAVIICNPGTHAPQILAAAVKGVNVLVEKPLCVNTREAGEIAAAVRDAEITAMMAYPKRYEGSVVNAGPIVAKMRDVRFVQASHFHVDNTFHFAGFGLRAATDTPAATRAIINPDVERLVAEELGVEPVPSHILKGYYQTLGSLGHDISILTGFFGWPERVLSTEIWLDGRGVTTTLDYGGNLRAALSWVDVPALDSFKETFEIYGNHERVTLDFPSGFTKGLPTHLAVETTDPGGNVWRRESAWTDNPFLAELAHFGECFSGGVEPNTPILDAVRDIELVVAIVNEFLEDRGQR